MSFFIVGLGNPGPEYENTRHNTGRIVLEAFRKAHDFPEWEFAQKLNAFASSGSLSVSPPQLRRGAGGGGVNARSQKVLLILPQTFMNKSGEALKNLPLTTPPANRRAGNNRQPKSKGKEIPNLAVIHDDLDIPFGSYKISFNKSSGGHKGVESIIKALKTRAFVRIRVGISPQSPFSKPTHQVAATWCVGKGSTPKGGGIPPFVLKKPRGEAAVEKTILGKFTPTQLAELKTLTKRIAEGLACLIREGREKAQSQYGR